MSEHFEDEAEMPSDDERDVLDQLLDSSLDEERYEFMSVMTELRVQAPHVEAYREHFTNSD